MSSTCNCYLQLIKSTSKIVLTLKHFFFALSPFFVNLTSMSELLSQMIKAFKSVSKNCISLVIVFQTFLEQWAKLNFFFKCQTTFAIRTVTTPQNLSQQIPILSMHQQCPVMFKKNCFFLKTIKLHNNQQKIKFSFQ